MKAVTGPDGRAVFHLPDPPPRELYVEQAVSGRLGACTWQPEFSTREVLERGAVGRMWTESKHCGPMEKLRGKFKPKPGEIVIFVRFLHWWERMQT